MSNGNKSLNNFFKNNEFIGSFQSYRDVNSWCDDYNCSNEDYVRTSGNCHAFIISKNGEKS